jgi:hypothetical protein
LPIQANGLEELPRVSPKATEIFPLPSLEEASPDEPAHAPSTSATTNAIARHGTARLA